MLGRTLVSRALLSKCRKNVSETAKRNAGHGVWTYRVPPPLPSKKSKTIAYVGGGICWYWILYHIATEPEHIYGDWPYIDPKTWTDEELGIPPDNAGPLKK